MSLTSPTSWRRHIWRNRLQTLTLLLMMAGFLALLGWLLWGVDGLWMLLFVGFLLFLFQPLVSPQQIVRLYGARALHPEQEPDLHYLVQVLSRRAGLARPPDLFYLPQDAINAFTVGRRDNAVVALSVGLLRSLNERELIGVLAHEISHISANDLRVMMLADGIGRLTAILSLFGQLLLLLNLPLLLFAEASINWWAILLLIFAPHLSVLAQLGLSRMREYQADLQAARISGDAEGLAQALLKIDDLQGRWLERMLFPVRRLPLPSLLRTHPPTVERVRRLLALPSEANEPLSGVAWRGPTRSRLPRWHPSRWWY